MNDLEGIIEDCNKSDLVSKKVIEKIIKIIGQKRWNRIHDEESDICTTMGELIITLKGIPDLEKEKCELLGIIQGKDKVIKDLKEKYDTCLRENTGLKIHSAYVEKKLIKAKELLKWALHSDPEHDEDFDQKWEEAEQFLKQE